MEAKELRLGNWFNHPLYDEPIQWQIDHFESFFADNDSATEHAKPIPLTEEWLLKFGFEKQTYGGIHYSKGEVDIILRNAKFSLAIFDEEDLEEEFELSAWHSLGQPFERVHQLQNLYFALTGKELEIKSLQTS